MIAKRKTERPNFLKYLSITKVSALFALDPFDVRPLECGEEQIGVRSFSLQIRSTNRT